MSRPVTSSASGAMPRSRASTLGRGLARLVRLRRQRTASRARVRRAPPRAGSRKPQDEPAEHERGDGEDDERGAPAADPRDGGDVTRDGEAEAGSEELSREDEAVDPAALGGGEPIADERRGERAGRGDDGAEGEPREQELVEVRHRRAPEHRGGPEEDHEAERRRPLDLVGEHAERQRRNGADERGDADEEADVGVR